MDRPLAVFHTNESVCLVVVEVIRLRPGNQRREQHEDEKQAGEASDHLVVVWLSIEPTPLPEDVLRADIGASSVAYRATFRR